MTLRNVTQVPRDDLPPGQVVAMLPAAGTQIRHGDAVAVTISARPSAAGGEEPPPQPIVTGTPPAAPASSGPASPADRRVARIRLVVPEGPARQTVRIVVIDQQGVHVAFEGNLAPGENLDKQVAGIGYTVVQVYIEGRLIQEIRP